MKAARYYGYEDIRVEEVPVPEVPHGYVRVRVAWAGICGTDRHEYTGPVWVPVDKPHPITGQKAPITLGHEFSGVIVAVGEGVEDWQIGDRVTASGNIVCHECDFCRDGRVNLCENLAFNGIGCDGAFAEYMVLPAYQLYKVPTNVTLEQAVLAEPLACGWHATGKIGDLTGKNVAVVGPGIIGLSCVYAAKAAGAEEIMVVGLGRQNEELSKLVGATLYVDSLEQEPIQAGRELTGKSGFDVVYECTGVQPALNTSCKLLRKAGTLVQMGVYEKMPQFDMNIFQEGERTLLTSQAYADEMREVLALMAKQTIPVEKLITATISLERIVEEGFEELLRNPSKHVKIAVEIMAVD